MAWHGKTTQGLFNVKRTGDSALGDAKASLSGLGAAWLGLAWRGKTTQGKVFSSKEIYVKKEPTFVAGLDAQEIAKRLRKAAVGEVVTYAELDALIGRSSRAHGLRTARNELMRERIVFGAVLNEGVKRLAPSEIVDAGRSVVRKINRASKRGIKTLAAADFESLNAQEQMGHNATMTVLALSASSTSAASVMRIERAVDATKAALPAAKAAAEALGAKDFR